MATDTTGIVRGSASPLGASVVGDGVNFSVFSRHATRLDLLLFDRVEDAAPSRVVSLEPHRSRTYHYWHVGVSGIGPGQIYGWRAHGPHAPELGLRFDGDKVLLDPYGRAVAVPPNYDRHAARLPGDNAASAMKSVVADSSRYDWQGDTPPRRPFSQTVIYEAHVRGFTRHPSSGVAEARRGTYAGLVEKIPYLKALGITAVELLPVFQFDPQDAPAGRVNYWGYQPVSFFAPHHAYASCADPLGALDEFRDMVRALHVAGIEVILDVVFNHTTEGGPDGPTLCYRGLGDSTYYILDRDTGRHVDYTGCGNTLNGNHPIVRRLIQDSLRYWVSEMHVDGFRFDLASILSRDEAGTPIGNPPVLWDIESDPLLAGTKLIAEAWDAAGLYQLGRFVGDAWHEWNGRFRDDVRRFMRGDRGAVTGLASRLLGSPDIFGYEQREAEQSINFVTCHDGFTLNDLVSYDTRHNEANGEQNRDGANDNLSWNCGVEGPSDDPAIEALRTRQVKNFLALQLLAVGTPMLLMGDEMRRTQLGNNNAYCQDNEISWLDWTRLDRHADIHRFVTHLTAFRQQRGVAEHGGDLTLLQLLERAPVEWHGVRLHEPDWTDHSHTLAFSARSLHGRFVVHCMVSAYREPLTFALPACRGPAWKRLIDTSLPSPDDVRRWHDASVIAAASYVVQPHSVVLLIDWFGET